jgi:hypothetical protein
LLRRGGSDDERFGIVGNDVILVHHIHEKNGPVIPVEYVVDTLEYVFGEAFRSGFTVAKLGGCHTWEYAEKAEAGGDERYVFAW